MSPAAKNGRNHILCKIQVFGKFSHQLSSSFQHCEISPVAQIWSFLSNFSHKIGDFCPIMLSCDANVEQSQFQLIFREFPGPPSQLSSHARASPPCLLTSQALPCLLPHNHTLPLRPPMTGPVLWEALARKFFHVGFLRNKEVVSARPPPTDWETSGR